MSGIGSALGLGAFAIAGTLVVAGAAAMFGRVAYVAVKGEKIDTLAERMVRLHDHDGDGSVTYQAKEGVEHLRLSTTLCDEDELLCDEYEIVDARGQWAVLDGAGDGKVTVDDVKDALRARDAAHDGNDRINAREALRLEREAPTSVVDGEDSPHYLPKWAQRAYEENRVG